MIVSIFLQALPAPLLKLQGKGPLLSGHQLQSHQIKVLHRNNIVLMKKRKENQAL